MAIGDSGLVTTRSITRLDSFYVHASGCCDTHHENHNPLQFIAGTGEATASPKFRGLLKQNFSDIAIHILVR